MADKIKEFKPDFLPNEEFGSEIPGLGPEMLDANVSVRGISAGGAKTLTFDRGSGATGTQTFTGFGFTPVAYQIVAFYDGTIASLNALPKSIGTYDGTQTRTVIDSDDASTNSNTYVIWVNYDAGSGLTRAQHNAFLADGIELDFITNSTNIKLAITCFQ